jgi:phosphotransferase system HPr-like phosphotransfer protein
MITKFKYSVNKIGSHTRSNSTWIHIASQFEIDRQIHKSQDIKTNSKITKYTAASADRFILGC